MKLLREILDERYEENMSQRKQGHLKALDKTLSNHYQVQGKIGNSSSKYNTAHVDSLKDYTNGTGVNYELWDHHIGKRRMHEEDMMPVHALDSALSHIKTPRSFHVYSNTRMDPRKEKNSQGVVHHPAYMSTSINPEYAKHWHIGNETYIEREHVKPGQEHLIGNRATEKHVLKIRVPKGHDGSYVGQHISSVPGQHEFIFPRGKNLKYHHTETEVRNTTDTFSHNKQELIHTHHMEIVK